MSDLPGFLTVADVAAWLRTSPQAVYILVARCQIPGVVRLGRRILFDERELLLWINEKRARLPEE